MKRWTKIEGLRIHVCLCARLYVLAKIEGKNDHESGERAVGFQKMGSMLYVEGEGGSINDVRV